MNLVLNVMVVVMFVLVHWYRDEWVESKKSVLYIMTAVYIGLAVRECLWAYMALGGYKGIYNGLRAVYNLVMSYKA